MIGSSLKGKKIFITGHTGFKGSWLTKWLIELGAIVRGYSLAPDDESMPTNFDPLFEEFRLSKHIDHLVGDIRNHEKLREALTEFEPHVVIHMAAQPLVRRSYHNPIETYETNVMGTVHLLDACRFLKELKTVLVISSDKCYENKEQPWGYREIDPIGGKDPYSNSKGCTELVTHSFRQSYFSPKTYKQHGISIASGRAGNVIGGGDWSIDRLIPDVIKSAQNNQVLRLRYPTAVRPWQHVLDPLSGYITLIEAAFNSPIKCSRAWNFGPGIKNSLTVESLISNLSKSSKINLKYKVCKDTSHEPEAGILRLDCTLANIELGWKPKFDIQKTIRMTIDWYSATDVDERREIAKHQLSEAMISP